MKRRSMVAVANEKVSIVTVCQMFGVDVDDQAGRSRKVHCPFGRFYHSDLGVDPAMRVYVDSNSAYCFSCTTSFTPVSMAAAAMDIDRRSAAAYLLDRIGYRTDLTEVFNAAAVFEPEPDQVQLAEALKIFCRRIDPGWADRQFEPFVALTLTRCLALLDLVQTTADAEQWLSRCKLVMRVALNDEQPGVHQADQVLSKDLRTEG